MRVGVMKPVETGCAEVDGVLDPIDARTLALAAGSTLSLELSSPCRYRSPLEPAAAADADAQTPPDLADISRCFREIATQNDAVIVEGVGGIATPLRWDSDFADLASMLELELIVVAANRDNCVNASMLTLKYAEARSLKIAGYILCDTEPALSPDAEGNEPALRRLLGALYLGRMRHREPLAKAIVEQLV